MRRAPAIAADIVVILAFVAVGRHTHDHGVSASGMVSTTWPFAFGLAAGWLVLAGRHRAGRSLSDAAVVVVGTVTVGMALRVVAGQGTALAFVVVALAFLGACMAGWRVAVGRRRSPTPVG